MFFNNNWVRDNTKITMLAIIFCAFVWVFVGVSLSNDLNVKHQNHLTQCKSFYTCKVGKIDYVDGQCVCTNVFPELIKKD
jgi:hypothetical protein